MILDQPNLKMQAVLAGAVATTQPFCHVNYKAYNLKGEESKPATKRTATNSGTAVDILPAPGTQGVVFEIFNISIFNNDTASVTVTVQTTDGTTTGVIAKVTLATLESLYWDDQSGWYAMTTAGARK